jgi:hypothetical protein
MAIASGLLLTIFGTKQGNADAFDSSAGYASPELKAGIRD